MARRASSALLVALASLRFSKKLGLDGATTRATFRADSSAAARERFLTEGVDGASLREIARDAGTSIGMVYYYFPTKDELFLAVVEEVYAKLLADLASALAPE